MTTEPGLSKINRVCQRLQVRYPGDIHILCASDVAPVVARLSSLASTHKIAISEWRWMPPAVMNLK